MPINLSDDDVELAIAGGAAGVPVAPGNPKRRRVSPEEMWERDEFKDIADNPVDMPIDPEAEDAERLAFARAKQVQELVDAAIVGWGTAPSATVRDAWQPGHSALLP